MLTILMGKSGTGKDMLQGLLIENGYIPLVSTTSRPMREGETQGVEYNFISRERFLQDIQDEKFLEYRSYDTLMEGKPDTWYYGMPKETLKNMKKGEDYITILDTAGTKDFLEYLGRDACFVCYIDTPDELREERAKNRGGFDKTEWDRRLHDDAVRFSEEKIGELADARLYNEGLSPEKLMDLFYRSMREYSLIETEFNPIDNPAEEDGLDFMD